MEASSSSGRGGEGTWTAVGGTGPWAPGVQQEAQPLCRQLQVQNCSHRVASQSRLEEGMRGQSSGHCGEAGQRGLTQWQKVASTGSCEGQAHSQGPPRLISAVPTHSGPLQPSSALQVHVSCSVGNDLQRKLVHNQHRSIFIASLGSTWPLLNSLSSCFRQVLVQHSSLVLPAAWQLVITQDFLCESQVRLSCPAVLFFLRKG